MVELTEICLVRVIKENREEIGFHNNCLHGSNRLGNNYLKSCTLCKINKYTVRINIM